MLEQECGKQWAAEECSQEKGESRIPSIPWGRFQSDKRGSSPDEDDTEHHTDQQPEFTKRFWHFPRTATSHQKPPTAKKIDPAAISLLNPDALTRLSELNARMGEPRCMIDARKPSPSPPKENIPRTIRCPAGRSFFRQPTKSADNQRTRDTLSQYRKQYQRPFMPSISHFTPPSDWPDSQWYRRTDVHWH